MASKRKAPATDETPLVATKRKAPATDETPRVAKPTVLRAGRTDLPDGKSWVDYFAVSNHASTPKKGTRRPASGQGPVCRIVGLAPRRKGSGKLRPTFIPHPDQDVWQERAHSALAAKLWPVLHICVPLCIIPSIDSGLTHEALPITHSFLKKVLAWVQQHSGQPYSQLLVNWSATHLRHHLLVQVPGRQPPHWLAQRQRDTNRTEFGHLFL
jgi:hypothetical protein